MLKIIHISDLHLSAPLGRFSALFDKRLIGFLNGAVFRKHAYDPENIRKAIQMIPAEKPDLIVLTGDATTCSQPEEFRLAAELLRPLKDTGIPILFTPGNHDCYVKAKECTEARMEFQKYLTGSAELPAKFETPECTFLITHSAVPTNPLLSCGCVSPETVSFLEQECSNKSKPIVLLSHFPVLKQEKGIAGKRRRLNGAEPIREMIRDGRIDLVLCGHIHKPYEILEENGHGEICAGSLAKAGIYRVITCDQNRFHFENRFPGAN